MREEAMKDSGTSQIHYVRSITELSPTATVGARLACVGSSGARFDALFFVSGARPIADATTALTEGASSSPELELELISMIVSSSLRERWLGGGFLPATARRVGERGGLRGEEGVGDEPSSIACLRGEECRALWRGDLRGVSESE